MEQIISLQKQHLEIMQLIKGTLRLLKMEQIVNNPSSVRLLLSTLSIKLKMHLTAVDRELYLVFLDNEESETRSKVRRFINEMGKIKIMFGDYAQKWLKTTLIAKDDTTFIMETNEIFRKLSRSISRENEVLCSLIENNCPKEVLAYC